MTASVLSTGRLGELVMALLLFTPAVAAAFPAARMRCWWRRQVHLWLEDRRTERSIRDRSRLTEATR